MCVCGGATRGTCILATAKLVVWVGCGKDGDADRDRQGKVREGAAECVSGSDRCRHGHTNKNSLDIIYTYLFMVFQFVDDHDRPTAIS